MSVHEFRCILDSCLRGNDGNVFGSHQRCGRLRFCTMTEKPGRYYSTLADDDELREIIVLFVEEMEERAVSFQKALQNALSLGSRDELRVAAHQFKGSAGSHGFGELSVFAKNLEDRLKSNASDEEVTEAAQQLIAACRQATSDPMP